MGQREIPSEGALPAPLCRDRIGDGVVDFAVEVAVTSARIEPIGSLSGIKVELACHEDACLVGYWARIIREVRMRKEPALLVH